MEEIFSRLQNKMKTLDMKKQDTNKHTYLYRSTEELNPELEFIQRTILDLSKVTLDSLINCDNDLKEMEANLQYIDSNINSIKHMAANESLSSFMEETLPEMPEDEKLYIVSGASEPVELETYIGVGPNLSCLDKVGASIGELQFNAANLIIERNSEAEIPAVWTKQDDFFYGADGTTWNAYSAQ